MTVPETLRAMAAQVRQGWCQGLIRDPEGRVCALGALLAVRHDAPGCQDEQAVIAALDRQISPFPPPDLWLVWDRVVQWNNAPGQTGENVAAAMELAAICEEQRAAGAEPTIRAGSEETPAVRQQADGYVEVEA